MRNVMLPLAACAMLALAGCSETSNQTGPGGGAGDAPGQSLLAQFLKQSGENLDACFDGLPVMRGPGDTQGVADNRRPVAIDRLVVALDSSGSMAARTGGATKLDVAKGAVTTFLAGVPANTQVGLVVFGHRGSNTESGKVLSCKGVETIYPLGTADRAKISQAMTGAKPTGWTPLASAITTAAASFAQGQAPGAQVVYVVSDGLETCGGAPVAAARALHEGNVRAVVNIIGLDLGANDRAQLKAVADAGGGTFVDTTTSALGAMLDDLQRKVASVSAITAERFDARGRTTANDLAYGRYVTKVNMCLSTGQRRESGALSSAMATGNVDGARRDAALAALRTRHEAYIAKSQQVAARLEAQLTRANGAVDAQLNSSEGRLGQH